MTVTNTTTAPLSMPITGPPSGPSTAASNPAGQACPPGAELHRASRPPRRPCTRGPAPAERGGTSVTITGTGFLSVPTDQVRLPRRHQVTVNATGTSITAVSPAGSGAVDVSVVTQRQPPRLATADKFTSSPAAGPTGVAPNVGSTLLGGITLISGRLHRRHREVELRTTRRFYAVPSRTRSSWPTLRPPRGRSVDITVHARYRVSATSTADRFTFVGGCRGILTKRRGRDSNHDLSSNPHYFA